MGHISKFGLVAMVLVLGAARGYGQLLVDDFSVEGSLGGTMPDVGSAWVSDTGFNQVVVSGGKVNIPPNGGEVVSSTFATQTATTIYAGFTINYQSAGGVIYAQGPAFLTTPTGSSFAGLALGGGEYIPGGAFQQFAIYVSDGISGNSVYWPVSLNANVDYRVVFALTENGGSDQLRLWVNPVSVGSTSVAGSVGAIGAGVSGFRFIETGYAGRYTADNLYVGTSFNAAAAIPEPTAGILLLSGLVVFARRRGWGRDEGSRTGSVRWLGESGRSQGSRKRGVTKCNLPSRVTSRSDIGEPSSSSACTEPIPE